MAKFFQRGTASTMFVTPDMQLAMDVAMIETTSHLGHTEVDPAWTFTDAAGHEHDASLESLTWALDDPEDPPVWFDGDGFEHENPSHYECCTCGERVEPATRYVPPSVMRTFIPGEISGRLGGTRMDGVKVEVELPAHMLEAAHRDPSPGHLTAILEMAPDRAIVNRFWTSS